MIYKCNKCIYDTTDISNFKKHCNSKKHLIKIGKLEKIVKQYICNICNRKCTTSSNLGKHIKICKEKNKPKIEELTTDILLENKILRQQVEEKDNKIVNLLEKQIEEMKKQQEEMTKQKDKEIEELKTKQEKGNMAIAHGGLGYCRKNYPDADPIESLDYDTVYPQEDQFEEMLLYKFKEKQLAIFFGNGLISEYKKDDPQEQSLWCSDTSRLSYIIRESGVKKNKWSSDKNGLKFITNIIEPILAETKTIIIEFNKNIKLENYKNDCVKVSDLQQNCLKLAKHLDSFKLAYDILKYIGPHFKLDIAPDE